MKKAFLFPGQGSQKVGMGRDIFNSFPQVRNIFEKAEEICSPSLIQAIFQGPLEELSKTINAQPAVYLVSYSLFKILVENGVKPHYVAGHSLGEYTALAAAGVFSFEDGLKLILKRAKLMSKVAGRVRGGMLAVLGLDLKQVKEVSEKSKAEVANFNTPSQIVLSGEKEALRKAEDLVKNLGGKAIWLNVEGPFHSSFMKEAALKFKSFIEKFDLKPPLVPVVMNVVAREVRDPEEIKNLLVEQIYSQVKWTESLFFLAQKGVEVFFDVGPGRVMEGMVKKTLPLVKIANVEDEKSLKKVLEDWGEDNEA